MPLPMRLGAMPAKAWVLCALAALVVCGEAARTLGRRHSSDYDYFLLVRQWPGTFCSQHACPLLKHRDQSRFTIHGLWPNRQDGTWPQFCDSSMPFDVDEVEDLRSDLDDQWPSFMDSSDNENFWAHEWNKHGTCALSQLPSEHKFFQTVLQLNRQYDLRQALQAGGIAPSTDTQYAKSDLQEALRSAFGVDLLLHCSQDGQLTEVWMCFDKQLQPMDCQSGPHEEGHCDTITIGPFPSSSPDEATDDFKLLPTAALQDDDEYTTIRAHSSSGQLAGRQQRWATATAVAAASASAGGDAAVAGDAADGDAAAASNDPYGLVVMPQEDDWTEQPSTGQATQQAAGVEAHMQQAAAAMAPQQQEEGEELEEKEEEEEGEGDSQQVAATQASQQQHGGAQGVAGDSWGRTLCIAASCALMGSVVTMTVVMSWLRRAGFGPSTSGSDVQPGSGSGYAADGPALHPWQHSYVLPAASPRRQEAPHEHADVHAAPASPAASDCGAHRQGDIRAFLGGRNSAEALHQPLLQP